MPDSEIAQCEILLKRDGVEFLPLKVNVHSPPRVECNAEAEIKMTLTCDVWFDGEFDYANDRIVPYITIDKKRSKLGEYIIVESVKESDGLTEKYSLTCFDITHLAKKSRIEDRVYWPAGTRYIKAIEERLVASGIRRFSLQNSSLAFQTDREDWDPGTENIEIINQLLQEMSFNSLYMDLDGVVHAKGYKKPILNNVGKIYKNDEFSILKPGATIKIDAFDHPNVFHYSCENPELNEPINVVSENNSPVSMFSTVRQGRVSVFRKVDNVASKQALQDLADREKLQSMISADEIAYETGLNPTHAPYEIVLLEKKEYSGVIEETYWGMDLSGGGLMEHRGKQAIYL